MSMYRAQIDQPSTLQPLHRLHGTKVIADSDSVEKNGGKSVTVALIDGPVTTMMVPLNAITKGWDSHNGLTDQEYNNALADGVKILIGVFEESYNEMTKGIFSRIGRTQNIQILGSMIPNLKLLETSFRKSKVRINPESPL